MLTMQHAWIGVVTLAAYTSYHIATTSRLSLYALFLMSPQWCEITDLVADGHVQLPPMYTLAYLAATVTLLVVCWFRAGEDAAEWIAEDRADLEVMYANAKDQIEDEDFIWESAKTLLENVELEDKLCCACLAYNSQLSPSCSEGEWAIDK